MRDNILQWLRKQKLQGTDDYLIPKHQIVLMGGNSLPVRVVLEALGMEHAVIIATDKVWKIPGPQLQEQAKKFNCKVEVEIIRSPWEEHEITAACERAREKLGNGSVGLHYTAGTKPMSAHAHTWWRLNCSPDGRAKHQCTYLDPTDGLVFDGLSVAFSDIKDFKGVALKEIGSLHGLYPLNNGSRQEPALVDVIATAVFHDTGPFHPEGGAYNAYREAIQSASTDGNLAPLYEVLGDVISPKATFRTLLAEKHKISDIKQYFETGWFENWLANKIERIYDFQETWFDQKLKVRGFEKSSETQLDIVVRKGYTALLISCTTTEKGSSLTDKAFEALHRANRLGGDHTLFIFASWNKDDDRLLQLWQTLARHWDEGNRFRVLGWKHYLGEAACTHGNDGIPCIETMEQMVEEWFK